MLSRRLRHTRRPLAALTGALLASLLPEDFAGGDSGCDLRSVAERLAQKVVPVYVRARGRQRLQRADWGRGCASHRCVKGGLGDGDAALGLNCLLAGANRFDAGLRLLDTRTRAHLHLAARDAVQLLGGAQEILGEGAQVSGAGQLVVRGLRGEDDIPKGGHRFRVCLAQLGRRHTCTSSAGAIDLQWLTQQKLRVGTADAEARGEVKFRVGGRTSGTHARLGGADIAHGGGQRRVVRYGRPHGFLDREQQSGRWRRFLTVGGGDNGSRHQQGAYTLPSKEH